MTVVHAWLQKWFWRFYAVGLRRQPDDPQAAFDGACGEFTGWLVIPLVGISFAVLVPTGLGAFFGWRGLPWLFFGVLMLVAWFGIRQHFRKGTLPRAPASELTSSALQSRVWLFRAMSAGIFFAGVLLGVYLRGDFSS